LNGLSARPGIAEAAEENLLRGRSIAERAATGNKI